MEAEAYLFSVSLSCSSSKPAACFGLEDLSVQFQWGSSWAQVTSAESDTLRRREELTLPKWAERHRVIFVCMNESLFFSYLDRGLALLR